MNDNIKKLTATIKKGEKSGTYVQSLGRQLHAIGFPTMKGMPDMRGTKISFEGCYPDGQWFTVNTPEGVKLEITVKGVQEGPDLQDNPPAVVPIRDPSPFYGLMLLRPVSNAMELKERKIELWFEALPEERWVAYQPTRQSVGQPE
ncbi:MAG: hypothetical protein JXL67_07425 [Calditrichaeota bacterium]|nr:hypothetical protein [Calditrichota bacterium]